MLIVLYVLFKYWKICMEILVIVCNVTPSVRDVLSVDTSLYVPALRFDTRFNSLLELSRTESTLALNILKSKFAANQTFILMHIFPEML